MGGSIFFFVESKTFEFSVVEGGTYYMLRIFERNRDSLRSVFMGKEGAKRLLAIVEDLMSNVTTGNFARTFREGDKVFILQLGSNSYGRFFMILELVHGRRKGFIVVPEGKLGSGWRGFGLHLRKVIVPESIVSTQPQAVLK
ncbi:transcription factor Pur-alpha 1-like [Castanea sativa]|uniref:transcription factor Pur-alpha 1-like n=1 Tax=Castanea sativa TaxID=21020 RepID=UPI003F64D41F